MKKKIFLVLILLSLVFVGGCDEGNKKEGTLSTPQQIEVKLDGDKSFIVFDEVENAEYYNIYINDMAVTVQGGKGGVISYDASKIITQPQTYNIRIKASGTNYYDSEFSSIYTYEHKMALSAPNIYVDGTVLNWERVSHASFYDILVTSSSLNMQSTYRFASNKFNFSSILTSKGEYVFKVKAISEDSQYLDSAYSNEIRYQNIQTLITPYKLQIVIDQNGRALLNFMSSENVTDFILDIDGTLYNLPQEIIANYMIDNEYDNLYTINLTSFLSDNNIAIDNSKQIAIKVKAIANNLYLRNSEFSEIITYQYKSVLKTPTISIVKGLESSVVNFNYSTTKYLGGFELYLNGVKYKTLPNNINNIELLNSEIDGYAITLKAISNNNNCYSSMFSNAVYLTNNEQLSQTEIELDAETLSWVSVENAEKYCIEIYNLFYQKSIITTETSINLLAYGVDYGLYNVKITAMAYNYNSSISEMSLKYLQILDKVENVSIGMGASVTTLTFDEVDNAYGYVIYLHDVKINHIFDNNSININSYVGVAGNYDIRVQAIALANSGMQSGELSQEQVLQSTQTLTAPRLSIEENDGKYYLNIEVNEDEKVLASGCSIWVNYTLLETRIFENAKIDITSYFTTAGNYTFMAQVLANKDNQYIKDSGISSISRAITKQLDMVTNIKVTKYEEESKYILTFDEQALVAKYEVTILKADDNTFEQKFELNNGFGDISQYIIDNGEYKVSVRAIAREGSFYTDSATSSNPYIFTKGLTLSAVNNFKIVKSTNKSMFLKWDAVENALSYKVNVYYVEGVTERLLLSTTIQETQIDLGNGDFKCFNQEGTYIFKVKTIGDGVEHESSVYSTHSYNYSMSNINDYTRNTIFMYGNEYNYRIETYEQLQNLLWYHYLYNNYVFKFSETISYNLKVYCSVDIDNLAQSYSEDLYNLIKDLDTNQAKMEKLGEVALSRYPEMSYYVLGDVDEQGNMTQPFCTNTSTATSIYLFRYINLLNVDKTEEVETSSQSFPDKTNNVDIFAQRPSNYVFPIDKLDSVNVTTSEQLFMAVQYGKKPNFVGDSSVAKTIYENARQILRQICADNMSDYEKVCQIYDYLSVCVPYNYDIEILNVDSQITNINGDTTYLGNIKDFYLEGVFYNLSSASAVSEGIAKAFVLMCSIEGIESIKVNGTSSTGSHAWNKVYISIDDEDKAWYDVDAISSKTNFEYVGSGYAQFDGITFDIGTHAYFLVTDAYLSDALGLKETFSHSKVVSASVEYDYYENTHYSYNGKDVSGNLKHSTSNQIEDEIKSLMTYSMLMTNKQTDTKRYSIIAEFDISKGGLNASTFVNYISGYYSDIRGNSTLNGDYNCSSVQALALGNKLIILFHNY